MTCADKLRDRIAVIEEQSEWGRTERAEAAEPAIRALPEMAAVIEDTEEKELREHGIGCRCRRARALAALSARLDGAS